MRLDWPDEICKTILGHIREAMDDDSIFIIDDIVIPDRGAHRLETQLDMTMLAVLNGQARSEADWTELLEASGLKLRNIFVYGEHARESAIIVQKA